MLAQARLLEAGQSDIVGLENVQVAADSWSSMTADNDDSPETISPTSPETMDASKYTVYHINLGEMSPASRQSVEQSQIDPQTTRDAIVTKARRFFTSKKVAQNTKFEDIDALVIFLKLEGLGVFQSIYDSIALCLPPSAKITILSALSRSETNKILETGI